jgi:hypothetical protein
MVKLSSITRSYYCDPTRTRMASDMTSDNAKADNDIVNAFKLDTNHIFQKDRNVRCAPDTGHWFFHHPEYQAFRAAKGLQLLWVTAEAGGKSRGCGSGDPLHYTEHNQVANLLP